MIQRLNPITTLVIFALCAILAMFSANPICSIVSFTGSLSVFFLTQKCKKHKEILFSLCFTMLFALINPLFSHNGKTVLFFINSKAYTLEAGIYGAISAISLLSMIYLMRTLSHFLTDDKLIYLLGMFSPKTTLAFSMALKFIPDMTAHFKKARVLYSLNCSQEEQKNQLLPAVKCFSATMTYALENGADTADSMAFRGYGLKQRTAFRLYRFMICDFVILITTVVLAVLLAILALFKSAQSQIYPVLTIDFSSESTAFYAIYTLIAFMPAIFETAEIIRWKYLRSKI